MSIYIFIDTNIAFRVITQGQPGCEPEQFGELRRLMESGEVTLLLPEVVLLELEKLTRNLERDFDQQYTRIEKAVAACLDSQKVWNEAEGLVAALKAGFSSWKTQRLAEAKQR